MYRSRVLRSAVVKWPYKKTVTLDRKSGRSSRDCLGVAGEVWPVTQQHQDVMECMYVCMYVCVCVCTHSNEIRKIEMEVFIHLVPLGQVASVVFTGISDINTKKSTRANNGCNSPSPSFLAPL